VKTATNKRLLISESHSDLNRCTPYRGKPDQHATYASHFNPHTPDVRFLWAVSVRDNLSLAPMKSKRLIHQEEVLTTKDRLTRPSSWVTSFLLPCDSPAVGKRGFGPMVTQLHQLTGPITPACNRYVQYLLTGGNRTVLNQHRWGLQPWRCRLATYPLPDLPNQLSPLSPKGPARSPF
jgi:hypothetical protein